MNQLVCRIDEKSQRTTGFKIAYDEKSCNSEILSTSIEILVTMLRTHKIGSERYLSLLRWAQVAVSKLYTIQH